MLAKMIGRTDGMITIDSCEFSKKGKESVGVSRQYCGPLGKAENCRSGVFSDTVPLNQPNPMAQKPSHENASDEQLVQLALMDQDSFYYIIKRYEPKIVSYIKRMTKISSEECQDLLQDIFIRVYRNLNQFNRKLKFSSWVYRIAHNEIINQYRKQRSYSAAIESLAEGDNGGHLAGFIGEALEIDNVYISRENAEMVRAALTRLPDKYREILILRYLEDKSYNEIGDILRKPAGTIATLIRRAKAKFKKIARNQQLEQLI